MVVLAIGTETLWSSIGIPFNLELVSPGLRTTYRSLSKFGAMGLSG